MKKLIMGLVMTTLASFTSVNSHSSDANPTLDAQQQKIVTIASLASVGELDQLTKELNDGLDAGLTVNQIKEVLVHIYAYSGFPRSLRGLQTFMTVLDERKARGINDTMGADASPITDARDKYERGKDILAELSGQPAPAGRATAGYAGFAPTIETFLKEHLFADIFERDVLTFAQREMATVAVLMSIGGVEPMMRSHMKLSLNVGITPAQLKEMVKLIEKNIGVKEAIAATNVMLEVVGADAANVPTETTNGVKVLKVSFNNRIDIDVVGNLFFPPHFDANKKYPAIVVGHTFTGVKEQTSGLHAQKLAERGYITLAFDASFWGESGGTPRNIEIPDIRIEDFSAAVDFLSNHKNVDSDKIGGLGICGGGGYVVSAAAIDPRLKAIATVSMYDLGRARRSGLGDAIPYEQRMQTLDRIGELRTQEFAGAPRTNTLGVPEKITENDTENTKEFYDYYRTPRAQHPNTDTSYSLVSQAGMMNFFPFEQIQTISPRPLLFIVGERAVSAYFSEDAYGKAAEPKELFVVPGASHVDLYDRPQHLAVSIPKLDSFFKQYMK